MKELVAKKYVKAILSSVDLSELDLFLSYLNDISSAFNSDKFKSIISLPNIKNSKKVEFLLSLVQNPTDKFKNFINLLVINKRIELIPAITNELKMQKSIMQNIYIGKIYGNYNLDEEQLSILEDKFSKRFNATIKLELLKQEYNGIKIELNDLGLEVGFSIDRLKSQMSEYILKAI